MAANLLHTVHPGYIMMEYFTFHDLCWYCYYSHCHFFIF